jgi:hypothetical protein
MKFQKSSSLKLLGQLELNFAQSFDDPLTKLCPAIKGGTYYFLSVVRSKKNHGFNNNFLIYNR